MAEWQRAEVKKFQKGRGISSSEQAVVTRDMWRLIYSLCQSVNQVVIMMNLTAIYKERSSNKEAFTDR